MHKAGAVAPTLDSEDTNTCMRPHLQSMKRFSDARSRAEAKRIAGCEDCKTGEVVDGLDSRSLFFESLKPFTAKL